MYSKIDSRLPWFFDYIGEPNTEIYGCTDTNADNYNPDATLPCDNCCEYWGCIDPLADNYDPDANVDDGSCSYSYGNADFSFGSISENNIEVIMVNDVAVGGFQFILTDTYNLITLTNASGGSAESNDFTVSTSTLGIVIGFSFAGDSISAGESLLTNLSYQTNGFGDTEICIQDIVVSDQVGNPLITNLALCEEIEIVDVMLGDINDDSILNIQDVVILINFILSSDTPEGNEFEAADLNSDGTLNVQDVVILIGLILG